MREITRRRRRALVASGVAGAACLLVGLTPGTVNAGLAGQPGTPGLSSLSFGSGVTITDGEGVDFDAACLIGHPLASVGSGNNVLSPGANPNCAVGFYDNSTEVTDFETVGLSSSGGQLVATFNADGAIPTAGNTTAPPLSTVDLPNNNIFVGVGYKAMFNNPSLQRNVSYVAATHVLGGPIYGHHEHWADGFHFFVGFSATWDGTHWLHSAQIGTYDPSPDGGFFFDELGTSTAPGVWSDDDPACFSRAGGANWDVVYGPGNTVTVKVKGVVRFSDVQAVGGCVDSWYAQPGNEITNVKGWATADATVTLPVTIPLSVIPGFGDITSVGGVTFPSDMTEGNSVNTGTGATLAIASGDLAGTSCNNEGLLGIRPCVSYTGGFADNQGALTTGNAPDTLGEGFRCRTPLWVPGQPCYIDDDSAPGPNGNIPLGERGTFLAEFWDTNYDFTF